MSGRNLQIIVVPAALVESANQAAVAAAGPLAANTFVANPRGRFGSANAVAGWRMTGLELARFRAELAKIPSHAGARVELRENARRDAVASLRAGRQSPEGERK